MFWTLAFWPGAAYAGSAHAFRSGLNCYGVWRLPDTGQTTVYAAGDDASYQPAAVKPGFTIYSIGSSSVTVDNVSGLMWVTNPGDACAGCAGGYVSSGTYAWTAALAVCENLSYAGYNDWRLPNANEIDTIVDYTKTAAPAINTAYFLNTAGTSTYWTSTTSPLATDRGMTVYFGTGSMTSGSKVGKLSVRCVRAGPY